MTSVTHGTDENAYEQHVLVADVVVQRHGRGADLAGQAAHRETGQALVIDDSTGGPDDVVARHPGGTTGGAATDRRGGLLRVHGCQRPTDPYQ
jgi:hypothetical protein